MTTLRLLADDLTGALDAAAEFTGLVGPVEVYWAAAELGALPANAALDTGTREMDEAAACAATRAALAVLDGAGLAYKKVDSLIRGQTLPELATCLSAGRWRHAILAPAFPHHGRVTRGGQQYVLREGGAQAAGPNLVDALLRLGVPAQLGRPGAELAPGMTVFDADSDAELAAIVAALGPDPSVLWCGTGGLARALSGGRPEAVPSALPRPVLGLFGSDQMATAAQLAACRPHWAVLPDGSATSAARMSEALDRHGIALASLDLPGSLSRAEACVRIGTGLGALAGRLPPPGTLLVAGGETLRGVCTALGATHLTVRGAALPGVPVSTLRGGAWDGVNVVSKSGAFGHPTLLRELLRIPELESTAP